MSDVVERASDPALDVLLPDADYADAFALTVPGALGAGDAARRAFGSMPPWITRLMAARNLLVTPFGLRTSAPAGSRISRIGVFPVISADERRVVLGFPDRHLDFRVVIATKPERGRTLITVTTLVRTHNALGRAYLACIMPFHRLIVPALLRQVRAPHDRS
jgi:hypothetical protein